MARGRSDVPWALVVRNNLMGLIARPRCWLVPGNDRWSNCRLLVATRRNSHLCYYRIRSPLARPCIIGIMKPKKPASRAAKRLETAKKRDIKDISRDGALEDFNELLKRASKPGGKNE